MPGEMAGGRSQRCQDKESTCRHLIVSLIVAIMSLWLVAAAPAVDLLVASVRTDQVLRYDGLNGVDVSQPGTITISAPAQP
jgi:hypothetical protein